MAYINIYIFESCFLHIFLYFISGFSASKCNFDVKMKQTLRNEGFHRNITYEIIFNGNDNQEHLYGSCYVGLDQTLPPGVYANPDELRDFMKTHKLNAIPKTRLNIELPAEWASPSSVFLIGKLIENEVDLWLPVHARYHQAVPSGGMARNEIDVPTLYLRCSDKELDGCNDTLSTAVTFVCDGSSKRKCKWRVIPYTMLTDTLIWEVPVGNSDHYFVVAWCTAVVVIVGSLYLLKAIHEYRMFQRAIGKKTC